MGIFKAIRERLDLEKEYLPRILVELELLNAKQGQESHDVVGVIRDVHRVVVGLAENEGAFIKDMSAKQGTFIEELRRLLATEASIKISEDKRRQQDLEAAKPGKHDDMF